MPRKFYERSFMQLARAQAHTQPGLLVRTLSQSFTIERASFASNFWKPVSTCLSLSSLLPLVYHTIHSIHTYKINNGVYVRIVSVCLCRVCHSPPICHDLDYGDQSSVARFQQQTQRDSPEKGHNLATLTWAPCRSCNSAFSIVFFPVLIPLTSDQAEGAGADSRD